MSTTTKTISAALKLVETKKENLKKAYDDLQSHSSLLSSSSFPFPWSHFDSHFTSLHNSLNQRFFHLQSLESQSPNNTNPNPNPNDSLSKFPQSNPKNPNLPSIPNDPPPSSPNPTPQATHLEALSAFCRNNDGKGLRDYIVDHLKDKVIIKDELQVALKCASDPAAMVLDSIDGVVGGSSMKEEKDLRLIKRSCNVLFQQLRILSPCVSVVVRKKANKFFVEWKGSLGNESSDPAWTMAFWNFVAAYGFLSELNVTELATFSAMAAVNDELPELCQIIGLSDKIPDIIHKLIDRTKHVLAVKFICQFNLADKIPPVPILKSYVNDLQKLATRLSNEGKSWNEIKSRQIHSLKAVIKVIQNHNLDSEYPSATLEQRIRELNSLKYAAPSFAANPPQQPQQQSGIKRPRTSAPLAGPAAIQNNVSNAISTIHQYQQTHFQSTGFLPEHPNPYMSSPAMPPYGMMAPTPTVSSYTVPSGGPYGLDGNVSMGPNGNLNQGGSHPNSSYTGTSTGSYGLDGIPMGASGNLTQGGSHLNSSYTGPSTVSYGLGSTQMGPSANLNQVASHPNSSEPHALPCYYDAYPGYGSSGLQQYYQTSYPQ